MGHSTRQRPSTVTPSNGSGRAVIAAAYQTLYGCPSISDRLALADLSAILRGYSTAQQLHPRPPALTTPRSCREPLTLAMSAKHQGEREADARDRERSSGGWARRAPRTSRRASG